MRLRLAVVLALVLGLFASPAFAQLMPTFGVKGGVGFASLSSDDEFVKDALDGTRTGLIIGGSGTIPVSSMIDLAIEVLYNQKGATGSYLDEDVGQGDVTAKLDYIQIPILGEVNFATQGSVMPFVNFGVAPAFKVASKLTFESALGEFDDDEFDEDTETFDFSLIFGGGVKFRNLGFEFRYDMGLVSVVKDDVTSDSVKTRQYAFLASLFF